MTLAEELEAAANAYRQHAEKVRAYLRGEVRRDWPVSDEWQIPAAAALLLDRAADIARSQERVVQQIVGREMPK